MKDPYQNDKDFADHLIRMGGQLISEDKESLTGKDFKDAGDLIRSLICHIEGLTNGLQIKDRKIDKLARDRKATGIVNGDLVKLLAEKMDEIGYLKSSLSAYETIAKC